MEPVKIRTTRLTLALVLGFLPHLALASLLEKTQNPKFFELQGFKEETQGEYPNERVQRASLVNLNNQINRWYLLSLEDSKGKQTLLNLLPVNADLHLRLDPERPRLLLSDAKGGKKTCDLEDDILKPHSRLGRTKMSYQAVCKDQLFIVIKQNGYQSTIEKGAEVIRWLAGDVGESLINDAKEGFFQDKYLVREAVEHGQAANAEQAAEPATEQAQGQQADPSPLPRAALDERQQDASISASQLLLKTREEKKSLLAGQWYPLRNYPGFYASLIEPGMVDKQILSSHRDRANGLDGVENHAAVYLMAFSLKDFSLGWGHGTDHPGVGWSERAVNITKDNPYGPDGFNRIAPLIPLGHTPPALWSKTVGTFSGGFQNRHAAFRFGELSQKNKAHHYGFMENGVLMVSPTVGLVSVIAYKDGRVDMKTWTEQDNDRLSEMVHIRQNGLPLIEPDAEGKGIPGKWVKFWGPGNWSGSANKELRTPRGAACLIETEDDRFFVYAYFSAATPSGIARVFQAYGCNYAIHLDMNSPGQAYASLARQLPEKNTFDIEHLSSGMHVGDGGGAPRYWIKPDYKDFFYIYRR
ncbi:MAG: hypothetical protein HQL47_02895 [Gammaproteobacteria bacterium]|nr:hypothetical protein [Gammaproteobacteria bacterium]